MTSAKVVETSVTNNSFFQNYAQPDDHTIRTTDTPGFKQEIIKVRERIPHIGPLTKVIPLKLLLGVVPSSSEDVPRAMRGQPKRLSQNYPRRNGGNVILYALVSFHTRDVFCTLSRLFLRPGFRLSSCLFGFCLNIFLPFIQLLLFEKG